MFFPTVGLLGKLQDQAAWDLLDAMNDLPVPRPEFRVPSVVPVGRPPRLTQKARIAREEVAA